MLEVLKAKGNVSQELKEEILAQKDPDILRQWFAEALRAETVEDYCLHSKSNTPLQATGI